MKSKPEGLEQIIQQYEHVGRLDVRESFFGGRCNALKLYHKIAPGERILYEDFTSLYPWTQKYGAFGVGHPVIITEDFKPIHEYFGIAKVTIEAPGDLYHPVLPVRCRNKLMFPLCKRCATDQLSPPCTCTSRQRALTGTWCTSEILMAIKKGYKVLKIYEVYHFPETTQYDAESGSGGLFAGYINTFLKIKQESSDWPKECTTDRKKKEYVEEYKLREHISLDAEAIKANPALRTITKSLLTNLWGTCTSILQNNI